MKLPLWSYWVLTCLTPHKGFHFQCPDTWKVGTYFFKLLSFIASVSLYTSLKTLQHKSCLLDLSVCKFCTVQVNKIKSIKRKIFVTFQAGYVRLSRLCYLFSYTEGPEILGVPIEDKWENLIPLMRKKSSLSFSHCSFAGYVFWSNFALCSSNI